MDLSKTLIVIAGPTAVGKTALAIRLAQHFHTEILSADSRQVYRELEIGTAKPSPEELDLVPHHFINTKSITEDYDAGSFSEDARRVMDELFKKYDQLVMVGGSGLYIKAVLEGFDELPEIDPAIRSGIIKEYELQGVEWLQQQVSAFDPDYFETVDKKNPQRLMRALEVIRATGNTYSGYRKKEKIELPFRVIKIGLELPREELYRRIDQRMDEMITNGLFAEAEKFFTLRHLNSLQTVGYQETYGFFEGQYDRDEAIRLMKRNSRRYAKRQMTWFKRDLDIQWRGPGEWERILSLVRSSEF